MEQILLKLLVADNATILEGTAELRKAFKNSESTPALCELIVSSANPQIRQYAAVLLRKRYSKGKHWTELPDNIRTDLKAMILPALCNESEKLVKNSIVQLIGTIVKHELPSNGWPEVLQFVQQLITSENLFEKELGMYTLATMTEVAPNAYKIYADSVVTLLSQTLNNLRDSEYSIAYYVMQTLQNLIPLINGNQNMINAYSRMMPQIMTTIQALTEVDEDKATTSYGLLDELCDNEINVIAPHVKPLISMCLAIANNKSLSDPLRVKALHFISGLARTRKKSLIKHKLVEPIIDTLFALMSSPLDDDSFEAYFGRDNEDSTPVSCATRTLDTLALHLPPEKLIPHLLKHIEPGLQGTDIYVKSSSYLVMAVLAEGCSEHIRSKYLESFLRCICQGIADAAPIVRSAALFALGQFSEHLQPDISQYSYELLPVLFEYLGQVCTLIRQEKKEPSSIERMFYALEMFCENLNESLLPYLPTLMEKIFELINADTSVRVKELTLSIIGSAAYASKENMLPYFEKIIAILNGYLTEKQTDETMCLQVQAVDILGIIARTIGDEHFAPLATRSLELGLNLLKENEDPDLRKSIYGLFASISKVMKKEIAMALPQIVEYAINSIRSSEGIVPYFKEDETTAFSIYEDLSDETEDEEDIENTDNEEDEDDEDVAGYTVENSYVEEKEEAISALKEIAQYTEEAFLPYLEKSFEEVFKLINYPQEDIRKAAIEALLQFCINFSKINSNEGKQSMFKALSVFIPKLSELIRLDDDRTVAMGGLDAYSDMLKEIKSDVFIGEGHKYAIMNCITDVMSGKTKCQDQEEGEDVEIEAEQDELLVECAGELLTNLKKVIPSEDFAIYFEVVLPMLLERSKKNKSDTQRAFAVGTISECLSGLKHAVAAFLPQLLPIFLKFANDSNANVRNNAIFGIGELALHGQDAVYPHYPDILQILSSAIAKESHMGARDNVLGAIARLIITNYEILPLDQVFPVFVNQLPLKEDYLENKAVFKSILILYQAGHNILQAHMRTLLQVAISVLQEGKTSDDETKNLIMEFVRSAQRDFPNDWNSVYTELPPEIATNIQQMFS
ncbi:PREDICTED: importin-4-like isoform X1 [Polistes canadensis]|uniref:importin-4-like isoform X1 n=1 Tax=Polistes canadensis TaxID=91411 RepID=UPI000718D7A0|nr:PREDICTED: importin-4-like isoform X1 [Polistes canadensis]